MKQFLSILLALWLCNCTQPQAPGSLPRSVPEKEGVSSAGILQFVDAIEQSGEEWHSFVLLRHGKVVAESWWNPYRPDLKHTIYSTSKTFTSTAIGFAVSEKLLTVEDKVISFFPDLLPDTISPYLAQMRVKDLLSMTTGQFPEPLGITSGDQWVKDFLSATVRDEPGTRFLYNSTATYMLSAIIQKVSGQRVSDFLTPRLFEPLDIQDVDWEICPQGINTGGWGLRAHTEDMAKLGQLYLQKGKWNGKQLLPEAWITEATTTKIVQKPDITAEQRANDDWAQGYCYQIWRCRNNAFRADGAFGQYIVVMPDQDAVLAIQANVYDLQKEINLVWNYLLPAMHPDPLPENKQQATALQEKLASLSILPPKGIQPKEPVFGTKTNFTLNDNDKQLKNLSIQIENDICKLTLNDFSFNFGKENWLAGETTKPCPNLITVPSAFREFPPFKVFCSYHWQDEQTLTFILRYIESPHYETIVCKFDGEAIQITYKNSLNRTIQIEGERVI
jgi:CubicO group peptidase (beta-lactamase class C family)